MASRIKSKFRITSFTTQDKKKKGISELDSWKDKPGGFFQEKVQQFQQIHHLDQDCGRLHW